jgi:hypothetical protein
MTEYNNSQTGNACSYSNLQNYNNSRGSWGQPAMTPSTVSNSYVVPVFGAPGYDTLARKSNTPSCSGYYTIDDAYGSSTGDCNQQYTTRMCGN